MNLAEIRKKAQQEKEAHRLETELHHGNDTSLSSEQQVTHAPLAMDIQQVMEPMDRVAPVAMAMEEFFPDECEDPEPPCMDVPEQIEELDFQPREIVRGTDLPQLQQLDDEPAMVRTVTEKQLPLVPEPVEDVFDPVAVLLEGREKAGCEDQFMGPAQATEVDTADSKELLCFRVSSEEYALDIMDIKEIIKPREVTEVPRVPPFVSGILSLRGIIIPVLDMNVRLGLAKGTETGKERIVVVKNGEEGFCGILVDEVIQVVRIEKNEIEAAPTVLDGIDREFVSGIGRVNGRILILLNMEKILDVTLF